jgi:two-component system response regulator HydG
LESVQTEGFLSELTQLTNVATIFAPPLRQRDADVISIANAILSKWAPNCGQFVLTVGAEEVLRGYDWPGNIEELEDSLKVAVASTTDQYIGAQHLPDVLSSPGSAPASQRVESLEQLERRHIEAVLSAHGGNKVLAARTLGIDRATLYRKLNRYCSINTRTARPLRG